MRISSEKSLTVEKDSNPDKDITIRDRDLALRVKAKNRG